MADMIDIVSHIRLSAITTSGLLLLTSFATEAKLTALGYYNTENSPIEKEHKDGCNFCPDYKPDTANGIGVTRGCCSGYTFSFMLRLE